MSVQCPKCGYTRTPTDRAPDYECPSCGVVYKKYEAFLERAAEQAEAKGFVAQEHERSIPRGRSQVTHEAGETDLNLPTISGHVVKRFLPPRTLPG